jgi:hypothetical protein
MRMTVRMLYGGEVRRRRANPLLGLYRWRWEIALLGVVAALAWLGHQKTWAAPVVVVLVAGGVLAVWPAARRAVEQRCRAVMIQHRLRSAFHELCLTTWAGRSPAILWTAPRRDGLRVHLLCPAGIAAPHFTPEVLATLAAACDAVDVRVEPNRRHTALLVLVVVTHVPVGGRPADGET